MRIIIPIVVACVLPGCWEPPSDAPSEATPPPAAALAPLSSAHTLDQALELLEAELGAALSSSLEGNGVSSVIRAEAITDRLLETRQPFAWIADERYFVDARIRQIQADADRILAQIQSGVPRDTVLSAITGLAQGVADLRGALVEGGTRAPPSLDQLLEGDTLPTVDPG